MTMTATHYEDNIDRNDGIQWRNASMITTMMKMTTTYSIENADGEQQYLMRQFNDDNDNGRDDVNALQPQNRWRWKWSMVHPNGDDEKRRCPANSSCDSNDNIHGNYSARYCISTTEMRRWHSTISSGDDNVVLGRSTKDASFVTKKVGRILLRMLER